MKILVGIVLVCSFLIEGCTSSTVLKERNEAEQNMAVVASGIIKENLTTQDMRALEESLKKDPEARDAVGTVTRSMAEQKVIKYCPKCGARYAPNIEICPIDKTKLNVLDN